MVPNSEPNTPLNAFVGAVVTVVLSLVPFSPLLGGAVSGYLEKDDGLRVGAISGLIATVPVVMIAMAVVLFFGLFAMSVALFFFLLLGVALAFVIAYVVGLSALGGYIGAAMAEGY